MTYEIFTTGPEHTQDAAARLARLLKGGETIELVSDLGGGKTTFVQGLARGLGYEGPVTSPTFTLSRVYPLPDGRELHHYDLYRLVDDDAAAGELADAISRPEVIVAVEWPERGDDVLPDDHLSVRIVPTGESERAITITATGASSAETLRRLA